MRNETIKTQWGSDRYLTMSAGEIPDVIRVNMTALHGRGGSWYGESFAEFQQRAETGDNGLVERSEEFLQQIEDQVPVSRGWANVDDVVGAIPNVPAFLAGHPQHMRRRQRVARDNAPLAVYADLTSSAGISSGDVMRRGIVLLALARLLIEHRPVELWVGSSLGRHALSSTVAWRIDTAPLDLARAAYHVASTSMSRTFGYGLSQSLHSSGGAWPFSNYDLHCRTAEERLRAALGLGAVLYVPPIMVHDPLTMDPVGWLKRVMQQYVGTQEDAQ